MGRGPAEAGLIFRGSGLREVLDAGHGFCLRDVTSQNPQPGLEKVYF